MTTGDCVRGDVVAGASVFKSSNKTLLTGHATNDFKES